MVQYKSKFILASLFVSIFLFFFCSNVAQATENDVQIKPELLQKLLSSNGVDVEIIDLNRDDGFEVGLSFEGEKGVPVILGFNENGLKKGQPFLISILGFESLLTLSENGNIIVINGGDLNATGLLDDFIDCILFHIENISQIIADAVAYLDAAVNQLSLIGVEIDDMIEDCF